MYQSLARLPSALRPQGPRQIATALRTIGGPDLCDVDLENGVKNPVGSSRHSDSSRHGDLAGIPGRTNNRTDGHGRNRNAVESEDVESEFDFIGGDVCLDVKR